MSSKHIISMLRFKSIWLNFIYKETEIFIQKIISYWVQGIYCYGVGVSDVSSALSLSEVSFVRTEACNARWRFSIFAACSITITNLCWFSNLSKQILHIVFGSGSDRETYNVKTTKGSYLFYFNYNQVGL